MCYIIGSIDQAVNPCPMCKVFPHTRCPHVRDTCRNRALHPRFDVLYLKNAEVDSFNGCGYCKWARANPSLKQAQATPKPGWPGCCRPPAPTEYKYIQPADWRSVSIVHHLPIPADIKAALDSLSIRGPPVSSSPPISIRASSAAARPPIPTFDRRKSSSPSSRSNSISGKSPAAKSKPGGSPKQTNASLAIVQRAAGGGGHAISTSVPTSFSLDGARRQSVSEHASAKRPDGIHSLHSSPNRKPFDLEDTTPPRRASNARPSTANATPPSGSPPAASETRSPETHSHSRASHSSPPVLSESSGVPSLPLAFVVPRSSSKRDDDSLSSSSSGSGSSDGLGSLSDSTVTSDGGFTDYLSDESEAELQRQAEAKAALVAQNQAEELEFKAARQQLAHVDLRPPKTWNPTNITNSTVSRASGANAARNALSYPVK